ncbi:MAG: tRNA pseudouridine(13) synthase TruD [Candidatus Bathyarchaeia archaeon]
MVPKVEKLIGIEVYGTRSSGIGGKLRQFVEDFFVEEILVDGSKAEIRQSHTLEKPKVLGSSLEKKHYLLCVLIKKDWDTFLALNLIAEKLGIGVKRLHIGGIKDTRAITAQYITVEDVSAEEIEKIQIEGIEIRPVGYLHTKISPYYLWGNNFHITIRGISHSKSATKNRIEKIISEIQAVGGVPNFFGHQRFGTIRPITHLVGKAFVKGNLKKAAMLFLAKSSPHEHPESRKARQQLKSTQNFKRAFKEFPKQLYYERLMLKHLAKKPDDFLGAFKRLPIKLRELFPQAYQAYLFNKFLSRRIKNGIPLNRAEVGDYVVSVEHSGLPMPFKYRIVDSHTIAEVNEAVKAGRMFVAIPIIGFRQKTSMGLEGEIEKQILEEERVSPEEFKIKALPEISMKGELRAAITPLNNFCLDEVSNDSANPSKRKVKLSFTLHRGAYATVFLRELMKPRNPMKAGF